MSPDPLDLTGKPPEQEKPKSSGSSSSGSKGKSEEKPGERTARRHAADLRERLTSVLERLVEWLEGRGDFELAEAIREDSKAIVGGTVSITRGLVWLRPPILFVLSVAEPALAFGRVLRILLGRWAERRARRAEPQVEPEPADAGDDGGPASPLPTWPPPE